MNIEIADSCGFCFGVERAVNMAEKNNNSKMVGEIIHNKLVVDKLKQNNGIEILNDFDELKKSDTAIIRTHGAKKEIFEKLEKQGVNIVDATCPYVLKLQDICDKMSIEGYKVIIFGDKDHPEIYGATSYIEGEYSIIASINEIKDVKLGNKVALVSQTTKRPDLFGDISKEIISRSKEVRIFNTICSATFDNQSSANKLSKRSDIMIIIGGKNSSNTKQLLNISKLNCNDSYFIENVDDIKKEWFLNKKNCGITAGASTPSWLIDNVKKYIKNILN